jgi:hypothetical protein
MPPKELKTKRTRKPSEKQKMEQEFREQKQQQ